MYGRRGKGKQRKFFHKKKPVSKRRRASETHPAAVNAAHRCMLAAARAGARGSDSGSGGAREQTHRRRRRRQRHWHPERNRGSAAFLPSTLTATSWSKCRALWELRPPKIRTRPCCSGRRASHLGRRPPFPLLRERRVGVLGGCVGKASQNDLHLLDHVPIEVERVPVPARARSACS